MADTTTSNARKRATRKAPAKKAAKRVSKTARKTTPHTTTEIVARKVVAGGQKARGLAGEAGRAVDARSRQVLAFLSDHPKVAASLAAGIITVGSAMLARKLQGKALPTKVDQATHKIAQAVQGLINK